MLDPKKVKNIRKQETEGGVIVFFDHEDWMGASVRLDDDPQKDNENWHKVIRPMADKVTEMETLEDQQIAAEEKSKQALEAQQTKAAEKEKAVQDERDSQVKRLQGLNFDDEQINALFDIFGK